MDKVQGNDDETGSGSGSAFSELSALENETDTLGRAIVQHERDARRIQSALHGSQRPFSKARPRQATGQRLQRREVQDGVPSTPSREQAKGARREQEPPLNVPREWGRKSRSQRAWTRGTPGDTASKEAEKTGGSQDPEAAADNDAIVPHRTAYTGDDYWSPTGDEPLPSIETTPSSMRRKRHVSLPTSVRHMNSTLRGIVQAENHDFSDASLLASTPAFAKQSLKKDELARLELQALQLQGVTSRNLDSIRERSPNGTLRSRRSLRALDKVVLANNKASDGATLITAESRKHESLELQRGGLAGNKENVPLHHLGDNENVPLHHLGDNDSKSFEAARTAYEPAAGTVPKNTVRPIHPRNDSIELLRSLAKVSSASPSPAGKLSVGGALQQDTPSKPSKELDDGSSMGPGANLAEGRDTVEPSGDVELVKEEHGVAQTPVVTGAWVNSPAVPTDLRPLLRTTDSAIERAFGSPSGDAILQQAGDAVNPAEGKHRCNLGERSRPRSALEEIVREAKMYPDGQYGETTLQSLENIVRPDLDATESTLTPEYDLADALTLGPMTQAEKDRRQESLAIEAMNKHLSAARSSIKDADRGLRRVENRIETSQTTITAPPAHPATFDIKLDANGRTVCKHCGGAYTSLWRGLWVEFRSNFYVWDPKARFGIGLTWLGATLLTWSVWYLLESYLCLWYCQPRYAYKMVGYGVDPDAPIFPFVIPTLALRPLRPFWQPAVRWIAWASGVLFHWTFGEGAKQEAYTRQVHLTYNSRPSTTWAGGASSGVKTVRRAGNWMETASAAAGTVTRRAGRSAMDAIDEVGRMWDQEFAV